MARKNSRSARPFSASTSQPPSRRPQKRSKPSGAGGDEAYTFLPSLPKRHRTSAQTLSLSRDEAGPSRRPSRHQHHGPWNDNDEQDEDQSEEGGSDDEMGARVRRLAMQIAQDDLAELGDSEESSIESEEAWEGEGSDEERWGDVFRDMESESKKKQKGKAREETRKVSSSVEAFQLLESETIGRKVC